MESLLHDNASWRLLEPYLDRALDLAAEDRDQWLTEIALKTPDIAVAIRQFLAEREQLETKGFLEDPSITNSVLKDLIGSPPLAEDTQLTRSEWRQDFSPDLNIAGYRLIREIGFGGMSAIWLAERSDGQLKRSVALKLPFVQSRRWQMAERFERERDILALLTHPNIACLYDAGISATGQPYLAMEYIEGEPLTKYCDSAKLAIRDRLKIFLRVLDAVQYAHTQLVLHRDLKPSNILVTTQGRVVLLDFGIAKIVADTPTSEQPQTELSNRAFTPDYASPEQISSQPLSTASDIYSLGVLLYELLTGVRPYRLTRNTPGELESAILSDDPQRMSQLTFGSGTGELRCTAAHKLPALLKGDLDTIVMKALKKNPRERYVSAGDFAQDIVNHLDNIPVKARPDSNWYRSTRFVSRHRLQVGAGAVVLIAMVFGAVIALWQAREATIERDRAVTLALRNGAVTEFLNNLIAETAGSERPISTTEMLSRSEKLVLANSSGNPDNRAAVLALLADHYESTGDKTRASALYESAIALAADSKDESFRAQLTCKQAFVKEKLGHTAEAVATLDRQLAAFKNTRSQGAIDCLLSRAYVAQDAGEHAAALQYAQDALQRVRSLPLRGSSYEENALEAVAHGYFLTNQFGEADKYYRLAVDNFTAAGRESALPALTTRNNWALVTLSAGVPKRALELYQGILQAFEEHDPNGSPPPYLVSNIAVALQEVGRYEAALIWYRRGLELARRGNDIRSEAFALVNMGRVFEETHDLKNATVQLVQVQQLLEKNPLPAETPAVISSNTLDAKLKLDRGDWTGAEAIYKEVLTHELRVAQRMASQLGRAEAELLGGKVRDALTDAEEVLRIAESIQGSFRYSKRVGVARLMEGRAFKALGEKVKARHAFELAVEHLANTVDERHATLLQARDLLTRL